MTAHKVKHKTTPEDVVALIALEMLKLLDLLHRKGNIMVRRMSSHTISNSCCYVNSRKLSLVSRVSILISSLTM